ncbi:hypothetical protein [Micromonospora parva]|uniref:hypothetical protein n=1 Tax=Micromonospora parva TaxID=1464048 RepID=UPI0033FBB669
MLTGRIIAESLATGSAIQVPELRVVRISREDVGESRAPDQPTAWTLLDVEAPDEVADDLASVLAESLAKHQGWYADFRVGRDHVVVFPGQVFRYTVGDQDGRQAAVDYGRGDGVPLHQLDWGD